MSQRLFVVFCLLLTSSSSRADEIPFNDRTDELVSVIDIERWYGDVDHLAKYNRYYRNVGVDQARDWLLEQFKELKIPAHLEEISIGGVKGYNVVAEIIGSQRPEDIYVIGAHYDSTSEQPNRSAPGAEDNASGTAGLLALARAIVEPPQATIRFVAFSGEEAGLYGSKAHVENIKSRGEKAKIKGVYIMDMIGYSADDDLDILIETSLTNQALVDLSMASLKKYCTARAETSFNYWGSDHVPFIENDMLTVLIIENDYTDYPAYHRSNDVIKNISKDMALQILKMIGGVMGNWIY